MRAGQHVWISIVISLAFALPPSAALGNRASVEIEADDSAAAACQVFVLVNSLVILESEDSLGLVTPQASAPLAAKLAALDVTDASQASCRSVIDVLRLRVPAGLGLGGASFVSGGALAPGAHVEVTGANSDAAVCQLAFLFDTIVIGGGAYGFPVGVSSGLVRVTNDAGGGSASCEAAIGEIDVQEVS